MASQCTAHLQNKGFFFFLTPGRQKHCIYHGKIFSIGELTFQFTYFYSLEPKEMDEEASQVQDRMYVSFRGFVLHFLGHLYTLRENRAEFF